MEQFTPMLQAIFLATANKALVDYLAAPIRARYPDMDLWWLVYVAFITGAVIAWFGGVNIFDQLVAEQWLARFLSAAFVGGGSSLIHDVFSGNRLEAVELEVDGQ